MSWIAWPWFVEAAIISSVFVLVLVIACIWKKTKNQPSKMERKSSLSETTNETTIVIENPPDLEITESFRSESTESLAETSSLADLWKRIKEDDTYQPTHAPSTSAPLAAVLQSTND